MIIENLKFTGALSIKINGEVVQETHNMVVNNGKAWVAARMKETGRPNQMSHMALGSGTTDALAGQAALVTQIEEKEALTTAGGTVNANVTTYECTFPEGTSTGTIYEAGIFNGTTSTSTMLARTKFDIVTKGANDKMTITWKITIS